MNVTESSSLASLGINDATPSTRPARTQPGTESAPPQSELSLTAASQAAFAGKPQRVAELRQLVGSGAYAPQATAIAGKMVDEASSRPE